MNKRILKEGDLIELKRVNQGLLKEEANISLMETQKYLALERWKKIMEEKEIIFRRCQKKYGLDLNKDRINLDTGEIISLEVEGGQDATG